MKTKLNKQAPPGGGGVEERGVKELINETWALIDKTKGRLQDTALGENDKIRWAGVLANAIGTLNKLLWKAGAGRLDEEDLATILSKVPDKYAKMVRKRISREKYPSREELLKKTKALKPHDLIEIIWNDASETKQVSVISNRVVETCRRLIGRFIALRRGKKTGMIHLLSYHQTTDDTFDMDSTPFPFILDVIKLSKKEARKKMKYAHALRAQWTSSLPEGGVKCVARKLIRRGQ